MESRSDIVIVSAFGRGVWLALELIKQGSTVTFVDVSKKIGASEPADWQGPFPLFKTTQFDERQWDFIAKGCELKEVHNGFTLWLPSGPWELRGPLFEFLKKKHEIANEVVQYVQNFNQISDPERRLVRHQIEQLSGRENWLAHFAHQIASAVYTSDRLNLDSGIPLSLFSPCYQRALNKKNIDSKYSSLKDAGARLFLDAKIEDLSIQSRTLDGIEIASERSGIVTGKKFVWMISGEESKRFDHRVQKGVFGETIVESSWAWVRFLVRMGAGPERDVMPITFTMVKDIHLPWTHGNMCFIERTENNGLFRVWMRVAAGRRFQRSYMTEMADDLIGEFRRRIPALEINIEEMPPEFHSGYEEIGPSRNPNYLKTELKKLSRQRFRNVYYLTPEDWAGLDWGSRMSAENRIYYTMTTDKREEAKDDSALHPN